MNTPRTTTTIAFTLALVLLAGLAAAADREVDVTRPADADATISIDNLAGSVEVLGWDRNEVRITGTLDPQAESLEVEGEGRSVEIEVEYPSKRNLSIDEGSHLKVQVPHRCRLEVETVSARITVSGLSGEVTAESISGDVTVRGAAAHVEAETTSGELDVELSGGVAALGSISGRLRARGFGELEASTVSGAIEVSTPQAVGQLDVESVSGEIEVAAAPARGARWAASSTSGGITLILPADVSARFAIESFSGSIDDAFGHDVARGGHLPGWELSFTQGQGDAEIELETLSGNVAIRKR